MLRLRRCILTQRLCYPATYSASSPRPRPPFPQAPGSPWRITSSTPAASPEHKPSRPPRSSPTSIPPPIPTPSSLSSRASASPAPMSPPSSPRTPSYSALALREPWSPTSRGSQASACGVLRSRASSCSRGSFRCISIVSRVQDNLLLFGSSEDLLRACKLNTNLLACKLERTVKPNVAILRECGLRACDITKLCIPVPWLLTSDVEHVRAMVASAEGIGVPRGSRMFRHALQAVAFFSEEKIAAKVEFLKKTFRWSDADVGIAVSKAPSVLRRSEEMLQRTSDFLILEVGLEPAYNAHRPAMLSYSLDGRLRPRYFALKFLKANGLLDSHWGYYSVLVLAEKVFVEKYICPYKEAVPRLAEEYANTCKGPTPTKLRFTPLH